MFLLIYSLKYLSPNLFCPQQISIVLQTFSSFLPENISLIFLFFFRRDDLISQVIFVFSLGSEFSPSFHKLPSCTPLTSQVKTGGKRGMVPCANYLLKIHQLWHVICRFITGSSVGQHWHEFSQSLPPPTFKHKTEQTEGDIGETPETALG